jgi:hypothetical protein
MSVIDEPAAAIAAGYCVAARSLTTDGRTTRHPRPCTWCDYPLSVLAPMVEGFNAWAQPKDQGQGHVYGRHDVRVFSELPRDEQERLVLEAQGLTPDVGQGGSNPSTEPVSEDRVAATKQVGQVQTLSQPLEPDAEAVSPAESDDLAAWT